MFHWIRQPKGMIPIPLLLVLLFAIACGAAATATPAPPAAKAPAAPAAPAVAAPAAAPTPTATPTLAPTPTLAASKPVAQRLKVAMTPPAQQTTVAWLGPRSNSGQFSAMYEALIANNELTSAQEPMLATGWELSKDALSVRFKLRKGVTFHTGKEFTAKDVVFSWERVAGQDSLHSSVGNWRAFIKSKADFEIVNDHEIIYHTAIPGLLVPYYSTNIQGYLMYSKDQWDAVGGTTKGYVDKPTGTGPFRFKELKEGQYILFEALDKHWRKVPEFKELQILYVPEAATRLAQLLTGEAQIAEIDRSLKSEILSRGMKVEPGNLPGLQVAILFGGNQAPDRKVEGPLSNKLVRQALNLATDRKQIQEKIFAGDGILVSNFHYLPQDEAFDPAWKVYPYDPAKAKQLLIDAGYANGFQMSLWTTKFPGAPEMPELAEALATMWKPIGVTVKIVDSEFAIIRPRYQASKMVGTDAWTMRSSAEPSIRGVDFWFTSPGVGGGGGWAHEDPFINERWTKWVNSADPVERRKLQTEIGQFLYDNYASIPLLGLSGLAGINPKLIVEYKCHTEALGPTRCHEYTQPVRK
jgi:peptide/nickel transport system substrate-binding protein